MPKGLNLIFQSPEEMLAQALAEQAAVGQEAFFRSPDPKMQKSKERWCAATFGLGYRIHVRPCELAVNDTREHVAADFFLRANDQEFAFQVAEAGIPGRRRGDEYKASKESDELEEFSPDWEIASGAEWVRSAIEKKAKKFYGGGVHLLVYANFWTDGKLIEFVQFQEAAEPFRAAFESIWVVTNEWVTSAAVTNADVGSIAGLGVIPRS